LNLSYTEITAPVDGSVGARSLRVGQFVQAGTQLMAVVPLDAVYVVANFKETQLTHVRDGQPVELRIDSFHGTTLKGHVDSLSPASGLEFALLPPTTPPAISPRSCSVFRSRSCSTTTSERPAAPWHVAEPTVNTKGDRGREREAPKTPGPQHRLGALELRPAVRRCIIKQRRTMPFTISSIIETGRQCILRARKRDTDDHAPTRPHRRPVRPRFHCRAARRTRRHGFRQNLDRRDGATLGAFMAVLNIQIVNARSPTSRARSAPASMTAAGSRPPI